MKYYHMIIQRNDDWDGERRREYISPTQGAAPAGWKCVAICGYHEKPRQVQYPCRGCVYYAACGNRNRTMPCDGRATKRDLKNGL